MKNLCWEYTLRRNEETSRVGVWILGNTKIGPVLDVKVCYRQGRHGVEIMIESLFRDRTVSWVRIVYGIYKNVTEASEEIPVASVENRGTGETCREGYTTTKADFNVDSCVYSLSWTKMDGPWSRKIQPRLFRSVKIYDQIVATWWYSSSRWWWSCKSWRPGRKVPGKIRWHFAMDSWYLDNFPAKKRRTKEKVPILLEP